MTTSHPDTARAGYPHVERFERILTAIAPYMADTVGKGRRAFGDSWQRQFEDTLRTLFAEDDARLERAARGYVRFALDSVRLHKRFERDRVYLPKTYDEAARGVYHNKEYMDGLYLPGILLSHYLWPHHYRQLGYFQRAFAPRVRELAGQRFLDVGVGTGFYSRQMLAACPQMVGTAYDISQYSLEYATAHVAAFGFSPRWTGEIRNVITNPPAERWPCLVSVEVLEHLEDPLSYLHALRARLEPGGLGFITAAITAPNEDHIYLYNNPREVAAQLEAAAFRVLEFQEDVAYEPKSDEPVPRLAAFIVS
jgi:SAM-dependent methyltransferase